MTDVPPHQLEAIIKAVKESIRAEQPQHPPPPQPQQQLLAPWRLEEFGLFEPDLPVDDRHPPGDVITVGRDTIYRNVDAFLERMKDAIASKTPEVVRDNLHLCLRGSASRWYTFEIKPVDKRSIRADLTPDLDQWTDRLQERFRPRMAQAAQENSLLTFTRDDVRNGKKVATYFQSKILRARAAGFSSVHAQLTQVYAGIEVYLRRDLTEPKANTDFSDYRTLLEEKESLWIETYVRPSIPSSISRPQTTANGELSIPTTSSNWLPTATTSSNQFSSATTSPSTCTATNESLSLSFPTWADFLSPRTAMCLAQSERLPNPRHSAESTTIVCCEQSSNISTTAAH